MDIKTKVSVIIPSFNQGQYLEETLLSVFRQDYNNFEVIVIDGGSSDNTVDIIKKYSDRIKYWTSEKDEGQTHAIIKGIEKSEGDYFMWLCSDDLILPSMLSISVYYHGLYPGAGLTYGDRIRIDGKGNIYSMQRFPSFKKWHIKWGFGIPQETTLIKRNIYEKTKGLDKTLQMAMDFDLWCKINAISGIIHIPSFLGYFRNHGINKSSLFSEEYAEKGFKGKLTSEYYITYKKHFAKNPSKIKIKLRPYLETVTSVIERRTMVYREEQKIIAGLRETEDTLNT